LSALSVSLQASRLRFLLSHPRYQLMCGITVLLCFPLFAAGQGVPGLFGKTPSTSQDQRRSAQAPNAPSYPTAPMVQGPVIQNAQDLQALKQRCAYEIKNSESGSTPISDECK